MFTCSGLCIPEIKYAKRKTAILRWLFFMGRCSCAEVRITVSARNICCYNRHMMNTVCTVCGKRFYAKPSHKAKGWGKYCSKECQYKGQSTGKRLACATCGKVVYKTVTAQKRSISGEFFCSGSCQTVWRNKQYSGERHANWTNGKSVYRKIMQRKNVPEICEKCKTDDNRILAVHHKDKNRENNAPDNLIWLCHNCHYLVHHFKEESEGFLT